MVKKKPAEDPADWVPLAPPLFHILVSLADDDRHGYAIMLDVGERTGGAVKLWPASLYGSLQRLVRGGLVTPVTVRGETDPRRRHYRAAGDLGLTIPAGVGWWLTIVFVVAAAVFFASQLRTVAVSEDARASVRVQLEAQPAVRLIVPASRREAKVFSALALTAGACEELLYRGFLLHYLRFWLPGGIAVGAAIVAFAAAHAYQGLRGVVLTGVAGAAAMAVYLVTGSLLAPAILHAVLDLANGLTAYLVGPTASVLDAQISDSA